MVMLKRISWHRVLALAVIFQLATGCRQQPTATGPDIVAQVGERTITAREFQLNYEFGFSSLKQGPNRKRSYLEAMINELVVSMEGYRLGLDKTERVLNLEAVLLQELLVEELLRTRVTEAITVSEDEIRGAITRSKVRWKFRFWAEADLTAADRVYEMMQEYGYADVVAERLLQEDVGLDPTDLETNYLTWLETPPELLEAIKDLQIGEISRPIELNEIHYLIQMIDIRREALSEYDYESTYERFEQILFHRKLKDATSRYVVAFMTAKNVVVKRESFQILAEALVEWQGQDDDTSTLPEAIEKAGETEPALQKLNSYSSQILVTFTGGEWSLEDFVGRMDSARLKIKRTSKQQFLRHLKREIGLSVRNAFLAEEATSDGLHESAAVQDQLRAWRDKWVYREMRQQYSMQALNTPSAEQVDATRSQENLEWMRVLLERKTGELRKMNTVRIYETVLDTITVTDFKKSRWANVFLFKNSSKRAAVPTVDPALGF